MPQSKGMSLNKTLPLFVTCTLLILTISACDRGPSVNALVAQATDSNVKRVAKMYTIFMRKNDWRGPQDKDELKNFIRQQNSDQMRAMGIDPEELDSLFLSERDQQPLKIRWQMEGSPTAPPFAIVFEPTPEPEQELGYQVGFTGSPARQVDQAEYDRLWSGEADWTGAMANERR